MLFWALVCILAAHANSQCVAPYTNEGYDNWQDTYGNSCQTYNNLMPALQDSCAVFTNAGSGKAADNSTVYEACCVCPSRSPSPTPSATMSSSPSRSTSLSPSPSPSTSTSPSPSPASIFALPQVVETTRFDGKTCQTSGMFGFSLGTSPDTSLGQVYVGAPTASAKGVSSSGSIVFVSLLNNGTTYSSDLSFNISQARFQVGYSSFLGANEGFGSSVVQLPVDMDGDGSNEIVVGSFWKDTSASSAGLANIVFMNQSRAINHVSQIVYSDGSGTSASSQIQYLPEASTAWATLGKSATFVNSDLDIHVELVIGAPGNPTAFYLDLGTSGDTWDYEGALWILSLENTVACLQNVVDAGGCVDNPLWVSSDGVTCDAITQSNCTSGPMQTAIQTNCPVTCGVCGVAQEYVCNPPGQLRFAHKIAANAMRDCGHPLPSEAEFGYSVSPVQVDGTTMLLVGAPGFNNQHGAVFALELNYDATNITVKCFLISPPEAQVQYDRFGSSVVSLGDLNHDGQPEVAIGCAQRTATNVAILAPSGPGKLYIMSLDFDARNLSTNQTLDLLYFTRVDTSVLATIAQNSGFGESLAVPATQEVDQAKLLVGAPFATINGGTNVGQVHVLSLPRTTPSVSVSPSPSPSASSTPLCIDLCPADGQCGGQTCATLIAAGSSCGVDFCPGCSSSSLAGKCNSTCEFCPSSTPSPSASPSPSVPDIWPPETTITAAPNTLSTSSLAVFSFAADESGATFECNMDDTGFFTCGSPQAYSPLQDGSHNFSVRAIDVSGNADPTVAWFAFIVDTVPPETTLTATPNTYSTSAAATFSFVANETGSTFYCRLHSNATGGWSSWDACTSSKSFTSLTDGPYVFEVKAVDEAGNEDATPARKSWTVDTTPPDTTVTSGPTGTISTRDVVISFVSSESASTFECNLQSAGAFWYSCTSPVSFSELGDGEYTFLVRAVDPGLLKDPSPAQRNWVVDTTQATAVIIAGPAGTVPSSSATFQFVPSQGSGTIFACALDEDPYFACTSPTSYTGLSDGVRMFRVFLNETDADTTPALRSWVVDTTAPETTISSMPAQYSNSSTAHFAFASSESSSTFECKLDDNVWETCSASAGTTYTTLAAGMHAFQVRATDSVGHVDATPAYYNWTIDTAQPNTTVTSKTVVASSAVLTFVANEGSVTFQCCLVGVTASVCAYAECTSPWSLSSLADGHYTGYLRAIDRAGNVEDTPAVSTWTIDTSPPDTNITSGPKGTVVSTEATITFTVSREANPDGVTFACRLDKGVWVACSSPHKFTSLADGYHSVEVVATDAAGNQDLTPALITWIVDVTPPNTVLLSTPALKSASSTATFRFNASEASVTYQCKLDSATSFSTCANPVSFVALADGSHTLQVRAVDVAANVDPTPASYVWTVDTTAPGTNITSSTLNGQSVVDLTSVTIFFAATEQGCTFSCQLDGGVAQACNRNITYSSLADGVHVFVVRATDGAGNPDSSPAELTWIVDTVPPNTFIGDQTPDAVTAQQVAQIAFSSDEHGSVFECQVDSAGWATCSSPRSLSGLQEGAHTFDVRAIDLAGNVDLSPAEFTWEVDLTPPDTVVTSGPYTNVSSSSAVFEFASTESNPDDVNFSCRVDNGTWVWCVSPSTFSGLLQGTHLFEVAAQDAAGNVDPTPAQWTWNVDYSRAQVLITSVPSGTTAATNVTVEFDLAPEFAGSGTGLECSLGLGGASQTYQTCISPAVYTLLADGAYTFRVRITSDSNSFLPAEAVWIVDTTPPQTTMVTAPPLVTRSQNATLEFRASEAQSTFECQFDGGNWTACDSGTYSTPNNLADGQHTLLVRASDSVGNQDLTPASASWQVDTTGPNTTITRKPSALRASSTATFEFRAWGEVAGISFECALDGSDFDGCTSPKLYSALADGLHTFRVRATDGVGNTDPSPEEYSWTIDTVPPDTFISQGPNGTVGNTTAIFFFDATNTSTFLCRLVAGESSTALWKSCVSPWTYVNLTGGSYEFFVVATDEAGNVDPTAARRTWVIDTEAPNTFITNSPSTYTASDEMTILFEADDSAAVFECAFDGWNATFSSCTSPFVVTGVLDGTHVFRARGVDPLGNADATPAAHVWVVDTVPPETNITSGPIGIVTSNHVVFYFEANEEVSYFECQYDTGTYEVCESPLDAFGFTEGLHTFAARAIDRAGNADETSANRVYFIDSIPPETTFTSGTADAFFPSNVTIGFVSNEDGSTFECSFAGAQYSNCTSPVHIVGLEEGYHTLQVRAIDIAGNIDATPAELTWEIYVNPPTNAQLLPGSVFAKPTLLTGTLVWDLPVLDTQPHHFVIMLSNDSVLDDGSDLFVATVKSPITNYTFVDLGVDTYTHFLVLSLNSRSGQRSSILAVEITGTVVLQPPDPPTEPISFVDSDYDEHIATGTLTWGLVNSSEKLANVSASSNLLYEYAIFLATMGGDGAELTLHTAVPVTTTQLDVTRLALWNQTNGNNVRWTFFRIYTRLTNTDTQESILSEHFVTTPITDSGLSSFLTYAFSNTGPCDSGGLFSACLVVDDQTNRVSMRWLTANLSYALTDIVSGVDVSHLLEYELTLGPLPAAGTEAQCTLSTSNAGTFPAAGPADKIQQLDTAPGFVLFTVSGSFSEMAACGFQPDEGNELALTGYLSLSFVHNGTTVLMIYGKITLAFQFLTHSTFGPLHVVDEFSLASTLEPTIEFTSSIRFFDDAFLFQMATPLFHIRENMFVEQKLDTNSDRFYLRLDQVFLGEEDPTGSLPKFVFSNPVMQDVPQQLGRTRFSIVAPPVSCQPCFLHITSVLVEPSKQGMVGSQKIEQTTSSQLIVIDNAHQSTSPSRSFLSKALFGIFALAWFCIIL